VHWLVGPAGRVEGRRERPADSRHFKEEIDDEEQAEKPHHFKQEIGSSLNVKMHTVLTRLNALAAFTMSTLAGLTFLCFLSTVFLDYRTRADINTVNVVVKHVSDYSASREKNDLGFLTFDLHVRDEG